MAVVLTLLLALQAITGTARAGNIPWWNIKLAQEQGPNTCVVEDVVDTKHTVWTECKYWNSRQVCGAKPLLRYECCEGFKQVAGTQGCTGVKPLQNVLDTARNLGAGKFVKYLEKSGLARELMTEGPYTLFAPSDDAMKDLPKDQKSRLDNGSEDQLRALLEYHMVEGRISSSQFRADLLVPTKYTGHKLRINKYSSRIETVNCAMIQRKDQEANNGVVHIIRGLLDPSFTVQRDIAELLVQDGRFQELSQALDKSGIMSKLREVEQPYTILAPSDEAFTKIRPSRLSKLMNDKQALHEMLSNHVLPHVMCLPAIIGEHRVRTFGANKVTFDCERTDVKVDGNLLNSDYTTGLNGVIYPIQDVLVPDRAKSLVQLLEEDNLSSFLELVQFAGLEGAFENFGEYTLFVPSEAAMFSLPADTLKSLKSSKEKARKFVLFHATQGRIKTDRLNNNQVIMSLDEQNPLRIQLYRAGITTNLGPRVVAAVEGATIQKADHEGINGVIHVINKALFSVNTTVEELLKYNGTFRIFLRAMEQFSTEHPDLMTEDKSRTFFIPTDDAFKRIGEVRLQRIMSDSAYLSKTVKNHMSKNMMISESIQPDLKYSIPSYLNTLSVTLEDGKIKVNEATALQTDIFTSNGVIHIINKVLLPP